ncbi:hypothetical protein TWF481_009771 [Arthrobotrys musiformis]|uniref:GPI inositol-deacylase winged helix domain-containing protein n=1 Tax=Arthrobotrys musiformis TaxID=47236 RepID=A0AAV9W5W9_9PEZI
MTPREIKDALKHLPIGPKAYDDAYDEAMQRVTLRGPRSEELANLVLSWITYAKRQLTTLELQQALAVKPADPKLDVENFIQIEYIVSACAGLVTVDKESNIVRLVHTTTQEYFERKRRYWFPEAEAVLAKTCVTYLLFDEFRNGACPSDEAFETQLLTHPLYDYAARNWGHHARAAPSKEVQQLVLEFIQNEKKLSASNQAAMASRGSPNYSQNVPQQVTCLHLASYFGLWEVVRTLLLGGCKPDVKDTHDQTPLLLAAANGHDAVVSLLLTSGTVDINSNDKHGRTPLLCAAAHGYHAVVENLLKTDKINRRCKDIYDQTPLAWAEAGGHTAVVDLLLPTEIDIPFPAKISQDSSFLFRAAKGGDEAAVRMLIEAIPPNSRDESGRTPLSWAAMGGREAVTKLLLESGNVDSDLSDDHGRTPLSWAAMEGHENVVKLLLESGVDANSMDDHGRTSLSWAAMKGHDNVVKLLLESGVDANSRDDHGRTSLSWAAMEGHDNVVKRLLESGVGANSRDDHGRTSLSWAAGEGHEAILKLLLEHGAGCESEDSCGRTSLWHAASGGHKTVVELLMDRSSAEASQQDVNGITPLLCAAEKGHVDLVKQFLEKGIVAKLNDTEDKKQLQYVTDVIDLVSKCHWVDFILKGNGGEVSPSRAVEEEDWHETVSRFLLDHRGQSLISTATKKGHGAVLRLLFENLVSALPQLLLEKAADIESKGDDNTKLLLRAAKDGYDFTRLLFKNGYGMELLFEASRNGHGEVVRLLLENGADIKSGGRGDKLPLYVAARNGHEAVVQVLLEKNTHAGPRNLSSPLSVAAQNGHEAVVQLLLENNADIHSKNNNGESPLFVAAQNGHEAVVRMLLEKNAQVGSKNLYGTSPLCVAAQNGHKTVIQLLLEKNADIHPKNDNDESPLFVAAQNGHEAVVRMLLEKNAHVNSRNLDGTSPLSVATQNGHEAVVRLLVERGADNE